MRPLSFRSCASTCLNDSCKGVVRHTQRCTFELPESVVRVFPYGLLLIPEILPRIIHPVLGNRTSTKPAQIWRVRQMVSNSSFIPESWTHDPMPSVWHESFQRQDRVQNLPSRCAVTKLESFN
jgi:hypothetical protein